MEEDNKVLATELKINYTINDSKFSDSFLLDSNDIQDVILLAVDLIDQFKSKNLEIIPSASFLVDPSRIKTKEAACDSLRSNIEKLKELETEIESDELSLTLTL